MTPLKPHARTFEQHRAVMNAVAYRMLGSMSDAEDIVQDTWLRWREANVEEIASPRAWLLTAVSRLCIDRQRRKKIEKLNYVGPWLPEPVMTESSEENDPETGTSLTEELSMAFLFLLEKLTPLERAVFVLNESFDFAHEEISAMLGIQTAHSRQLLRRARNRVGEMPNSTWQAADDASKRILGRFVDALASRDVDKLREILTDDIIAYSDGGGRVAAALIPLVGFDKVTTVLLHLVKRGALGQQGEWRIINGGWGHVIHEGAGIYAVTTAEIRDGKIARIYTMRNPAKLHHVA